MGFALVAYGFAHLENAAWSSIPLYLLMIAVSLLLYYAFS